MGWRYERPANVAKACALLAEVPGRALVLAGGTDLQVRLRARTLDPELVVDVKGIEELTRVGTTTDGALVIGAAVTMRRLYEDARASERCPALARGAEAVGSLQVRCRATLGGNICNASPCMDTAPALLVVGAMVRAASTSGERDIPIAAFFRGVKQTALAPGELCTAVVIPAAAHKLRTAFGKVKRLRGHDLALVNAAAAYDPAAGTLRAAVGSCAPTPVVTEPVHVGRSRDAAALGDELAARALAVIRPIDDVRASAEYRRDMTALLCRRLARELFCGPRAP